MEQNFTFNQLPKTVTTLTKEVSELKRLLIENQVQISTEHPGRILTIHETDKFLEYLRKKHKRSNTETQLKSVFRYLKEHTATVSMTSAATGIPEKNICRYKRKLEKKGLLWKVIRKKCQITNYPAWYLTTNINSN